MRACTRAPESLYPHPHSEQRHALPHPPTEAQRSTSQVWVGIRIPWRLLGISDAAGQDRAREFAFLTISRFCWSGHYTMRITRLVTLWFQTWACRAKLSVQSLYRNQGLYEYLTYRVGDPQPLLPAGSQDVSSQMPTPQSERWKVYFLRDLITTEEKYILCW